MPTYRIGTSGYSYPQWRGTFYPPDLSEKKMLGFYAQHLDSVEVNYTFYRMPTVRLVQGWARETPEEFRFALKAPRRITHDLRLRDAGEPVAVFTDITAALGARLGVLLFQLPPFLKRDIARLEDFLHQLPPEQRVAFEFRNQSWFEDGIYDTLRRFNAALCIAETAEGNVPPVVTANFGYFRLRKPEYDEAALAAAAEAIRGASADWEEVFVYFKHEDAGVGPQYAAALRERLTGDAT